MPHIIGKDLQEIKYPLHIDEYKFLFEASNERTSLIACEFHNKKFFIRKQKKNNKQYIIKGEKITRPSPIAILHNALKVYSKYALKTIIKANISTKQAHISDEIKTIDFFNSLIKESKYKKYELEIGFGSGRHILDLAKKNPNIMYIGLEIYKPSLDQVSNLIKLNKLDNIYLCSYDARSFIKNLDPQSLDAIYVHFPVPWDKKPSRRIFSQDFIDSINIVLKYKARLMLRTDSIKYYDFVVSLFSGLDLEIDILKNEKIGTISKYEDRWLKMNKDIYDITYMKNIKKVYESDKYSFDFDYCESIDLAKLKDKFIKNGDGFIKFRDIYQGDNDSIISIIFGNDYFHESRYIHINSNKITYFTSEPTKHKLNFNFHKIINQTIGCS